MKQPLRTLKLKAWRIMSDYVRQRDKGVCYTCGDRRDWKKQEAGHFFHRKKYPASYFDPRNIHAQCVRCNHFLSGNLAVYAKRLIEQYGAGIIEELHEERNIEKVGREFYENIVEKYKPFAAGSSISLHGAD